MISKPKTSMSAVVAMNTSWLQGIEAQNSRAKKPRQIESIRVEFVEVGERYRHVNDEAVKKLAESMKKIGLRTPISVRYVESMVIDGEDVSDVPVLVTGYTRLKAARLLGWERIDAFVDDCDETQAKLWEIAENLHRAELTTLERDEQIAEWIRLTEQRVLAQLAPKPNGGRPESGVRAASREIGIDRDDARRAAKVASLTPEAKVAAREAGLDDNRSALLEAAKAKPDEQADVVRQIADRKAHLHEQVISPNAPSASGSALWAAWLAASSTERTQFLTRIGFGFTAPHGAPS